MRTRRQVVPFDIFAGTAISLAGSCDDCPDGLLAGAPGVADQRLVAAIRPPRVQPGSEAILWIKERYGNISEAILWIKEAQGGAKEGCGNAQEASSNVKQSHANIREATLWVSEAILWIQEVSSNTKEKLRKNKPAFFNPPGR